ncbi:MAG: tetrahydrodipicolinate N-succinyltransferase N-terminal domain-containing protein, partial [Ilumatobacteraceae bacterium]
MNESGSRSAWGRGLATVAADGTVLDTWYPDLGLGIGDSVEPTGAVDRSAAQRHDDVRGVDVQAVELSIDLDAAPTSAGDVYLRLHLLSSRLCTPRSINLDGVFGLLTNVAWTNIGPVP